MGDFTYSETYHLVLHYAHVCERIHASLVPNVSHTPTTKSTRSHNVTKLQHYNVPSHKVVFNIHDLTLKVVKLKNAILTQPMCADI